MILTPEEQSKVRGSWMNESEQAAVQQSGSLVDFTHVDTLPSKGKPLCGHHDRDSGNDKVHGRWERSSEWVSAHQRNPSPTVHKVHEVMSPQPNSGCGALWRTNIVDS